MTENNIYIRRCIELGENGLGFVAPNPMVGCVIVYNGNIIGEGYHRKYRGPHAEVNAINSIKDKELLEKSTLFVNLEPCAHFGKTPPCADLIIKTCIQKVVIGIVDPHKEIAGKGILKLENSGIDVTLGIIEDKCRELNKRFLTFHEKKRPYIILKWAQTRDGFIGIKSDAYSKGKPAWITDEKLRILVHKWRAEEQSIMIGTNTAMLDNSKLNVRDWQGNNPIRIVLDQHLRLPENLHVFDKSVPTIIFTSKVPDKRNTTNPEYIRIDFNRNIVGQICNVLFEKNIQSVFVEGGTLLLQTFIDDGTWDEARIFTGNKEFYEGISSPIIEGKLYKETIFDNDRLVILKNNL